MKVGWEEKNLGEVCEYINRGISPKYVEDNGLIVLNQKCIRDHKISFYPSRFHDNFIKKVNPEKIVRKGDVLVNSTGVGTLGRIAQVKEDLNNLTVDSHITIIRPKKDIFFNEFFGWALIFIEEEIAKRGEGCGGQTELARSTLKNDFTISYPKSIYIQEFIVAILDKVFTAIDKVKANTEKNLKNVQEMFESYLQSVFENRCDMWEEKPLKEVCELKPPKKEARDKLSATDMVAFLPMEDLAVLNKEIESVKERQLKDVVGSYTYFANNDVLLAKITPCFENGKIGIARNLTNGIGFGSSEYIVLRSKGNVLPDYLYYFLSRSRLREEGKKLMAGAVGHKRVSKDWIENYVIPFPKSLFDQQIIVQKLDTFRVQTKKLEKLYQLKLDDLEKLRKSILKQAFNGELKSTQEAIDK